MTSKKKKLLNLLKEMGFEVVSLYYEHVRSGPIMNGPTGGWWFVFRDNEMAVPCDIPCWLGLNIDEAIENAGFLLKGELKMEVVNVL